MLCAGLYVQVSAQACGERGLTSDISHGCAPPYFLKQAHIEPGAHRFGWLDNELLHILLPLPPQHWGYIRTALSLPFTNPVPRHHSARTSPSELHPQPWFPSPSSIQQSPLGTQEAILQSSFTRQPLIGCRSASQMAGTLDSTSILVITSPDPFLIQGQTTSSLQVPFNRKAEQTSYIEGIEAK